MSTTPAGKSNRKIRPCEAGHCSENAIHLFKWPTDAGIALAWTQFVRMKRDDFSGPDKQSRLCYRHFKDDAFVNLGMYKSGAAKVCVLQKLLLLIRRNKFCW